MVCSASAYPNDRRNRPPSQPGGVKPCSEPQSHDSLGLAWTSCALARSGKRPSSRRYRTAGPVNSEARRSRCARRSPRRFPSVPSASSCGTAARCRRPTAPSARRSARAQEAEAATMLTPTLPSRAALPGRKALVGISPAFGNAGLASSPKRGHAITGRRRVSYWCRGAVIRWPQWPRRVTATDTASRASVRVDRIAGIRQPPCGARQIRVEFESAGASRRH